MKNILVWGCGKSGVSAFEILHNKKDVFFLYDISSELQMKMIESNKKRNNVFVLSQIDKNMIDKLDLIVISPGVSIYEKYIQYAKSIGVSVVSELELGFLNANGVFFAITGTNGKTTTTKLLFDMFKFDGKKTELVGNIGIPVCERVEKHKKTKMNYVCEVSSFQLEATKKFKPHIAGILNITPDHIDRHKNFSNYQNTKFSIAKNMTEKDFLVLNNNSEEIKPILNTISCQVYFFDVEKKCLGTYLKGHDIFFNNGKKEMIVANIDNCTLFGKHNMENILCAVCMALLSGISKKSIQKAIDNFEGFPHRLERFAVINGVTYVDDSKATNIDATRVAINAMSYPTILLLGGSDKGYEFDAIFANISQKVKYIVAFGATKNNIAESARKYSFVKIDVVDNMKIAVKFAKTIAVPGDCVLLSPACASFDEFKNYKERGEKFREFVEVDFEN